MVGVQVTVDLTDSGPEDPLQRDRAGRHDDDPAIEGPEGGRDLAADPAGPDDDDPLRVHSGRPNGIGIGQGPKREDA